eukprot:scaffold61307_cov74-Phaeocystis_antarctica.AAC.1
MRSCRRLYRRATHNRASGASRGVGGVGQKGRPRGAPSSVARGTQGCGSPHTRLLCAARRPVVPPRRTGHSSLALVGRSQDGLYPASNH